MDIRAWYRARNVKLVANETNEHVDELLILMKENLLEFFEMDSSIGIEYLEQSFKESSPAQKTLLSWWNSQGKEFFMSLANTSFEQDDELTANLDYTNFLLESNLLSIKKFTDDSVETLVDVYLQLKTYINELILLNERSEYGIELENSYPYGEQLINYYDSDSLYTGKKLSQGSLSRGSYCLCA